MLQVLAVAVILAAPGAVAAAGAGDGDAGGALRRLGNPDQRLDLNVHIYGFSYHTDRQGVRRTGLDNQLNLGLGLNRTLHEDERGIAFAEAGFYRDSGSHIAKLAGVGYQYKYGRWRLGGALVGIHSPTYNHGRFFIAPLPILSFDLGPVQLNAIYVPNYSEYNKFAVFGFYFSMPLGK